MHRVLGFFLFFCSSVLVKSVRAERNFLSIDSTVQVYFNQSNWLELVNYSNQIPEEYKDCFVFQFRVGVAHFMLGDFKMAEKYLNVAHKKNPFSIEVQYYLAKVMLAQNKSFELAWLQKKEHWDNVFTSTKMIASLSVDAGLKNAQNESSIGALNYYALSVESKFSMLSQTKQSISFLQQKSGKSSFNQFEYFNQTTILVNPEWQVKPILHLARTNYTYDYSEQTEFDNNASYFVSKGVLTNKIKGLKNTDYYLKGEMFSYNLGFQIQKRIGNWQIGIEPIISAVNDEFYSDFNFISSGKSDSLLNGKQFGSGKYYEIGSGKTPDTVQSNRFSQIGISVGYVVPALKKKLALNSNVYFLNGNNTQEVVWSISSLFKYNNHVWLNLNYMNKGRLPLLNSETGQYFNGINPINYRIGCSLIMNPNKKMNFVLTYQNEAQKQLSSSGNNIIFHGVYGTLRLNL